MKRLLLFSAFCIPIYLFAQGFGSFTHDQPFFSKDRISAQSDTNNPLTFGIAYHWVASDLSNSPVDTWTDRIQGIPWVQTTAGNRPTWTTNGVRFTSASSQYFTTNGGTGMNWKLGTGGSAHGDALLIIIDRASLGEKYILGKSINTPFLGVSSDAGGTKWYNSGANWGSTTTCQWYDYLFAGTNAGTGLYVHYTNGVVGLSGNPLSFGQPTWFGRLDFGGYWDGTVKELIIWTNVGFFNGFTSAQVSNVHFYATNTYKYSP